MVAFVAQKGTVRASFNPLVGLCCYSFISISGPLGYDSNPKRIQVGRIIVGNANIGSFLFGLKRKCLMLLVVTP